MVDKVKPLKVENSASGGTEIDLSPTEADPSEDYLSAKGLAFEASDSFLLEKVGGIILDTIPDWSVKPTFSGDDVTNIEYFSSATQITANRTARVDITYSGDDPTTEAWKIYDTADGTTVLRTLTVTHTWSGDDLTNSVLVTT